jgi:hypothetical protein
MRFARPGAFFFPATDSSGDPFPALSVYGMPIRPKGGS